MRRNLKLGLWDGVNATPLTLLSQPGNIVTAALLTSIFAFTTRTYGLIVSLPFWFNFIQVLLTPFLTKRRPARTVTIGSAWLHVAAWAALIAVLPFVPRGENTVSLVVFFGAFSLISLAGSINGVSWNSWMQEAVPPRLRGKYFGARNRLLYLSMIAFLLLVSGLLSGLKGDLLAYQLLIVIAIVMRMFSVRAQQRMQTTTSRTPSASQLPWREQVRRVRGDPVLMRFILVASLMGFAINLFGPFYPVFMYDVLNLSVAKANYILLFGPLGAAIAFPAWGRLLDRHGNIPVMIVALALWQSFNVIWCFVDPGNLWLLYMVSTTGGLFSAGYGIGVFSLLLKITPPDSRTMGMALFVSITCLAAALGPPIGGFLISSAKLHGHEPLQIYHVAFAVAPITTLFIALGLARVREVRAARVADVIGAMRNVRTLASLFGLSFFVNRVVYRTGARRRRVA